ncbi:MAG: hypothetical protein PHS46_07890 [Candidatus Omnitrophica bacterium]|nr:hypothetical protein [Candidatus Omnitrophota bacterium]
MPDIGDIIAAVHNAEAPKDVIKRLGEFNDDLMANCNQLRDRCWKAEGELARWQQIAIEERAKCNWYKSTLDDLEISYIPWDSIATGGCNIPLADYWQEYREQAAQELQLEAAKEAGYVDRLEAAYIDAKSRLIAGCDCDGYQIEVEECDREEAQAALVKIREGQA